jgi:hypothetical protein
MPSKTLWRVRDCWVASFDILGFKNLVNVDGSSFAAACIQDDYEETLEHLEKSCNGYHEGDLEYCWLSDTFIMFTPDNSAKCYSVIQQAAKHFIEKCLYSSIPIRGAVSVGSFISSHDNRSLMGRAFIDAFVCGEDQDWLGLLLTPQAVAKARSFGLEPSRHDFVVSPNIPMRKCAPTEVMAYRFQNGSANFDSPLIPVLEDMMRRSDTTHHPKYQCTIDFIKAHYRYL